MSHDEVDFDFADQAHHDLLLARLTQSDSARVSGDIEEATTFLEVPKIASNRAFLQSR
jgi:hypothetical protein